MTIYDFENSSGLHKKAASLLTYSGFYFKYQHISFSCYKKNEIVKRKISIKKIRIQGEKFYSF